MKAQYRSAVTLAFVTFVCAVIAILMHALRERFIASWFVLNKNVLMENSLYICWMHHPGRELGPNRSRHCRRPDRSRVLRIGVPATNRAAIQHERSGRWMGS